MVHVLLPTVRYLLVIHSEHFHPCHGLLQYTLRNSYYVQNLHTQVSTIMENGYFIIKIVPDCTYALRMTLDM